MTKPLRAFVGLGANLGPRLETIQAALDAVSRVAQTALVAQSSRWETPALVSPLFPGPQPPYVNAVAELSTTLSAPRLLRELLQVEAELGRVRRPNEKWGPRVIDLDLLLFGDEVHSSGEVVVPHPRLHERDFVLGPLDELAPDVVHPVLGRTVHELWVSLGAPARRVPLG